MALKRIREILLYPTALWCSSNCNVLYIHTYIFDFFRGWIEENVEKHRIVSTSVAGDIGNLLKKTLGQVVGQMNGYLLTNP